MNVNLIHRVTSNANFKDHNFLSYLYIDTRHQIDGVKNILLCFMVEASGVEPLTYRVQNGRSTN